MHLGAMYNANVVENIDAIYLDFVYRHDLYKYCFIRLEFKPFYQPR